MVPFIDMHSDVLEKMYIHSQYEMVHEDMDRLPYTMVDFSRMEEGGAMAQFFSMFMLFDHVRTMFPGVAIPPDEEYLELLHGTLIANLERHSSRIGLARNLGELEENLRAGKMSAFLTIEGGRAVDGSLEKLERFYEMDVRLISLTWNHPNCFGFPNSRNAEDMRRGLTDFGKEAVVRMQELGMLVDVSHLSDGGFYDVDRLCSRPYVASHSNCRELSAHPRNLTDDMLRRMAEKGGVMGINFCPQILDDAQTGKESRIEMMVRHIRHAVQVGGEDCVGIGSDFDGISGDLEIPEVSRMQKLFEALEREKFTSGQIEKIAFGNVKRVIGDAMR